jgi:uncharacterized protein
MKIELDDNPLGKHRINAYSRDGLVISETRYTGSVIVTPDSIINDWGPRTFADLAVQHIQALVNLEPEIILLGTGASLQFPDDDILQPVYSGEIGLEIMDTGAACRAYNFLSAEGRKVIAALLQITAE